MSCHTMACPLYAFSCGMTHKWCLQHCYPEVYKRSGTLAVSGSALHPFSWWWGLMASQIVLTAGGEAEYMVED